MEELCIMCNKSLTDIEIVTVKEKGIETIKKCSIKRDDGLVNKLDGLKELVLHVSCRKAYINESMIKSYLKKKNRYIKEQSSDLQFDYNLKCILCNKDAKVNNNSNKGHVRTVKLAQTKESLESYALQRGDFVSEMIRRRIQNVDLVAVQAKYHKSCYDKFRFPTVSSAEGSRKRGRPECDSTIRAMDEIYTFIQSNKECPLSINDFKGAVSGVCPDERIVIKKIKEKFGNRVIISRLTGKPTLFCFANTLHEILHDAWYTARNNDTKEENLTIVHKAVSIKFEDTRTTPNDTSQYPPQDPLFETDNDDIPQSLNTLLEH